MRPVTALRRREIVCQQAVELMTDYLEGAMPRPVRRRFERHLAQCPHCAEYLAQMRAVITLAGRVTPGDLAPEAQGDLIALYRQWRDAEGTGREGTGREGTGESPEGPG
jgi:anti-sigma factor RsiW